MIKHHHLLVHMSMSTAEQCVVVKRGGEDWERHLTVLANQNFSLILTFTHFSSQSGAEQWTADLDYVGWYRALFSWFSLHLNFTQEMKSSKKKLFPFSKCRPAAGTEAIWGQSSWPIREKACLHQPIREEEEALWQQVSHVLDTALDNRRGAGRRYCRNVRNRGIETESLLQFRS